MSIGDNLSYIRARIEATTRQCGRDPNEVRLVVVTKNQPLDAIEEVIGLGANELGENRSQEVIPKYAAIGDRAYWHFIGHLQMNKVRQVVPFITMIHSVDSVALAKEIDKRALAVSKVQDILIEVNVSNEESKYGFSPGQVEKALTEIIDLKHIHAKGLMTMAPFVDDEVILRNHFSRLRKLRDSLRERFWPGLALNELSMGMTNDFEIAIEEGSTIVRIGTAIFRP